MWVNSVWRVRYSEPLAASVPTLSGAGAPEAVLDLCEMAPAERIQRSADAERHFAQGLRVLGVARAHPELVARAPLRRRGTTGPRGTMTGLLRGAPIF